MQPSSIHGLPADVTAIRLESAREDGTCQVTTTITEDKRVAAAVVTLDEQTAIVPRGAYRTTPTGSVEASRTFEGLSHQDALKQQSYLHLRHAVNLPKKPLLERVGQECHV